MNERSLTRYNSKSPTFVSWRKLRLAAKRKTPVWIDKFRFGEEVAGAASIPAMTEKGIVLNGVRLLKPPKTPSSDLIAGLEVGGVFVSVYEVIPGVRVIARTLTRNTLFQTAGSQAYIGSHVVLFIEEPVDPGGERCLCLYFPDRLAPDVGEVRWGAADIQKILAISVRSSDDKIDDILDEAKPFVENTYLGYRPLSPVRDYLACYDRIRKKKAPDIWRLWENEPALLNG